MKKQDNLSSYMKDLKFEEPSADFTRLVMERVRLEAIKSPAVYQPLINRQLWWKIFFGTVLFCLGAILLHTFFPGNDNPALTPSFYQIDSSFLLKPFQVLSTALNSISTQFFMGAGAISLLLFADQLYTRLTDRGA
jgi:hypothetical protein